MTAQQKRGSDHDETDNRSQLDHREPELEAAIRGHAAQVDGEENSRENQNPNPGAHAREPIGHVSGGGHHFRADVQGDAEPVSGASDESEKGVEIKLAINAERSGSGVSASQFAESHGKGEVAEGGDDEAENGSGSGDLHRRTGTEQKTGANGS